MADNRMETSAERAIEQNPEKCVAADFYSEEVGGIPEKEFEKLETGAEGNADKRVEETDIPFEDIAEIADKPLVTEKEIEAAGMSFPMEQTYLRAVENEKTISTDIKEAVSHSGGRLEGFEQRLKMPDSFKRKVEKEVFDKGVTEEEALDNINDAVRYTEVADGRQLVESYEKCVDTMTGKGYEVVQVKNTWETNQAYKGINIVMENSDGYKFELQFHTRESLEAKEKIHPLYEEARLITTSKERRRELEKEMREITDDLNRPEKIEMITNRRQSK